MDYSKSGLAEWLSKGRIVVCADAEEIAEMKAAVSRLLGCVDELTHERDELKARHENFVKDMAETIEERDMYKNRVIELVEQRSTLDARTSELSDERNDLKARVGNSESDLEDAINQIERLRDELAVSDQILADTRTRLGDTQAELHNARRHASRSYNEQAGLIESLKREALLKPGSRYEMVREFNKAIGAPVRDRPLTFRDSGAPADPYTTNTRSIIDGMDLVVEEAFEMFGAWTDATCEHSNAAFLTTAKAIVLQVIHRSGAIRLASAIDGAVDTAYTLEGLMTRLGVDMDAMFRLVHENNMTKLGGPKDPVTGKQLKPEGYKPPDIVGELERQARGEK